MPHRVNVRHANNRVVISVPGLKAKRPQGNNPKTLQSVAQTLRKFRYQSAYVAAAPAVRFDPDARAAGRLVGHFSINYAAR
jgi:hypothetical protein